MHDKKTVYILRDKHSIPIDRLIQWLAHSKFKIMVSVEDDRDGKYYRMLGQCGNVSCFNIKKCGPSHILSIIDDSDMIIDLVNNHISANIMPSTQNSKKKVRYIRIVPSHMHIDSSTLNDNEYVIKHSFLYGPGLYDIQHAMTFMKNFRHMLLPNNSHKIYVRPLYIFDFLECISRLIYKGNNLPKNVLEITGVKQYSIHELFMTMRKFLQRKIMIMHVPPFCSRLFFKLSYPIQRVSSGFSHTIHTGDMSAVSEHDLLDFHNMSTIENNMRIILQDMYEYRSIDNVGYR